MNTYSGRWLTCDIQIAKMLQNLANKPSYAKEAYMLTLNPFIENNKARINVFLNNLCEIGDFYDTLEVRSISLSCFGRRGLNISSRRWTNIWRYPRKTSKFTLR
jgi:hypothetical protein